MKLVNNRQISQPATTVLKDFDEINETSGGRVEADQVDDDDRLSASSSARSNRTLVQTHQNRERDKREGEASAGSNQTQIKGKNPSRISPSGTRLTRGILARQSSSTDVISRTRTNAKTKAKRHIDIDNSTSHKHLYHPLPPSPHPLNSTSTFTFTSYHSLNHHHSIILYQQQVSQPSLLLTNTTTSHTSLEIAVPAPVVSIGRRGGTTRPEDSSTPASHLTPSTLSPSPSSSTRTNKTAGSVSRPLRATAASRTSTTSNLHTQSPPIPVGQASSTAKPITIIATTPNTNTLAPCHPHHPPSRLSHHCLTLLPLPPHPPGNIQPAASSSLIRDPNRKVKLLSHQASLPISLTPTALSSSHSSPSSPSSPSSTSSSTSSSEYSLRNRCATSSDRFTTFLTLSDDLRPPSLLPRYSDCPLINYHQSSFSMPAASSSGDLSNLTATSSSSHPLTPMFQSPSPSSSSSPPPSTSSLSTTQLAPQCHRPPPTSDSNMLARHDRHNALSTAQSTIATANPRHSTKLTSQMLAPMTSNGFGGTSTHLNHHQLAKQQHAMGPSHHRHSSSSSHPSSHPPYADPTPTSDTMQVPQLDNSIPSLLSTEAPSPNSHSPVPTDNPTWTNHPPENITRQASRRKSFKLNGHSFNLRRAASSAGTRSLTKSALSSSKPSTPPLPQPKYFSHASQPRQPPHLNLSRSSLWMTGSHRSYEDQLDLLNPSDYYGTGANQVTSPTLSQSDRLRFRTSDDIEHTQILQPVNGHTDSRPTQLKSLITMPQDDLNLVQKCSVSVTSMTCSGYPSTSHHHVIHEQQSNSQGDATPSNICKGGWNPFQEDIHMVRHTTKLLKSRDSRTGRLIINQYMKGKEIGRGVHGVVYIGKNMDKVLRSNTSVQPDDKILAGSVSPGPQRLSSSLIFGNLPSSSMSATSMDTQMASLNLNDSYSQAPYYRVEDDYETVAIKVVRREPRGPKSLRRSQMQRQREREAMDDCLNCYSPSQKVNGDANGRDNRSILSPELSIGRVPLLKDVDDKLKKEIAIMKRLRHRHIVQLKEVIDDAKSKKVFMILEFMEGGQVLWQDPLHQTPLMTVEQARNTFRQVLLGLEYLHYQGIIHRDIKPANLLWTADRATVKISDFGVSHISGVLKRSASTSNLAANLAAENVSCDGPRTTNSLDDKALRKTEGSPAFMAPELCCPVEPTPVSTPPERNALDYFTHKPKSVQDHYSDNTLVHRSTFDPANAHRLISLPLSPNTFAKGQRPTVGKGIDIWALGVTLYCLLFGRTPFNAPNEYELFNVIWNEPILVPSRMGIEGQAIDFNPDSSCADGPVERDSRELVDLLRRLLDKDPRRRIQLKEVKTHPWVLNNLDNTQHWVNETAPLGCDAVHVTTEEVANFSRPRDSLKVYKPLGGVKQSLRKAAIKLGLQRSSSSKLDRLQKKSATSPNPGPLPSARRSSPPPQTYPILAARKSAPLTRRKITVDTSNLGSPDHGPLSLGNDITPVTESSDYASPYNAHTTSLLRGFGGCSEWASASTSQVSPIVVSRSSLPVPRSQPSTPTIPSAPVSERHIPELLHKPAPLNLCHSPFLSCFASSPTNDANSEILHSSVSSPRNSAVLIDSLQRSIDPHNSHLLAQPDLLPQADRIQQRRSLPTSPAPLLALVSLSRSSLAPSRTTSPIATSEGGYVKPSHHARFRDALSRVKQRFSRSRSRTGSLTTTCNETASSDLDNSQLRSEVAHDASDGGEHDDPIVENDRLRIKQKDDRFFDLDGTHRSELFNSDAGNPRPESLREENEGDAEADEEQEEDDDIDDFSSISHEACGPLMYHDGTKWNFPRLGSHSTNEGGSEPWTSIFKSRIDDVDAPKDEEVWEGGTAGRVNQTELTPRPQNPSEYLSEEADRLRQGLVMMRSAISEWEKPRLTIRPASLEDGRVEYRSSDDDDDEIDSTGQKRWTKLNRSSSQVVGPVDGGGSREQDSEEDEGNYTLQIEVKRRKRGASKSEGCG